VSAPPLLRASSFLTRDLPGGFKSQVQHLALGGALSQRFKCSRQFSQLDGVRDPRLLGREANVFQCVYGAAELLHVEERQHHDAHFFGNGPEGIESINLAKICQASYHSAMSTMNISLPDSLKSFVDEQVAGGGFGTSSEYVRELIRKDRDRLVLRGLLLEGASSPPGVPADGAYFASLRDRVTQRAGQ